MQNPINDWNAEFQVPLAENLELLNLFPRDFSLKKWKSPGDEVGNYLEPANLESMEWNPESRIQDFPSWIITMISPRLHFFFVYANSQITDICND